MPRDRFNEFSVDCARADAVGNQEVEKTAVTIDVGAAVEDMGNMRDFFREVDEVKSGVSRIKKKVQEIEQFHGRQLTAVSGEESAKSGELDKLIDTANEEIQNIRNKLKLMETKNLKLGADSTKNELSAEQRIRISQHGNVTKKFLEAVTEYQEIQVRYKNKYRDRLERQYKIVKPNATHEEVKQVLDSGMDQGAGGVFAQQILMGAQHAEAKRALYDIQERHQEIIKIERSILELHQLFLDMAVLVDAQGDMINQIEHYVQSAADHTNKGVDEMKKAVKSQRKSRRRMCCLLFILLIGIVIAAVVVTRVS